MKTERRHELQTNTLSDVLGHQIEGLRPHSTKLLAGGILGAVIVITIAVIVKDRQSALSQARNDLYLALAAQDREALKGVAKEHSGTMVAWLAKVAQADIDLANGLSALYINRDEAFQSLDDAKKAYTEVQNGATNNPDLVRRALFGIASAHEASSNLDKAREYYERVVQQYPDSPMAAESRSRLEVLKDPQTEKWYSWFARQQPKPRTTLPGMSNFPGMTGDLGQLPDKSDLGPLAPFGTEGPTSVPTGSDLSLDTKPGGDSKDETSPPAKPAANDPADTKPNETGKPAEQEKSSTEAKKDDTVKGEAAPPTADQPSSPAVDKPGAATDSPSEPQPPATNSPPSAPSTNSPAP